jgi:hypothetical protein
VSKKQKSLDMMRAVGISGKDAELEIMLARAGGVGTWFGIRILYLSSASVVDRAINHFFDGGASFQPRAQATELKSRFKQLDEDDSAARKRVKSVKSGTSEVGSDHVNKRSGDTLQPATYSVGSNRMSLACSHTPETTARVFNMREWPKLLGHHSVICYSTTKGSNMLSMGEGVELYAETPYAKANNEKGGSSGFSKKRKTKSKSKSKGSKAPAHRTKVKRGKGSVRFRSFLGTELGRLSKEISQILIPLMSQVRRSSDFVFPIKPKLK